jgi:hypothetical protein
VVLLDYEGNWAGKELLALHLGAYNLLFQDARGGLIQYKARCLLVAEDEPGIFRRMGIYDARIGDESDFPTYYERLKEGGWPTEKWERKTIRLV